jgi:tRNA(Ile)-lysidine synthase TilS/MesJ
MSARGPRLPRTPENDIRLIANYCQRLDTILARLTTEEIRALSDEDRNFLANFAGPTGSNLCTACDIARDQLGAQYPYRARTPWL